MGIDERLDRLTGVVESLAASVAKHREQIVELMKGAESPDGQVGDLSSTGISRL